MKHVFLGLSFLGESCFVNNGDLFLINICLFSNYLWYGVVLGFGQALRLGFSFAASEEARMERRDGPWSFWTGLFPSFFN